MLNFLGIHYETWELFAMAFVGLVFRGAYLTWKEDREERIKEPRRRSARG